MVLSVLAAAAGCVAAAVVIVAVAVVVVGKVRLAANVIKPYRTVWFTLDNPSPTPVAQSVVILDLSCTNVVRRCSDRRTRQSSPITAQYYNTINNRRSRACIINNNRNSLRRRRPFRPVLFRYPSEFSVENGKQQGHQVWFRRRSATQSE